MYFYLHQRRPWWQRQHSHRCYPTTIAVLCVLQQLLQWHSCHGFASYLLSSTGCLTELDTSEVIMNHPVEDVVPNPPLQLELVDLPSFLTVDSSSASSSSSSRIVRMDPTTSAAAAAAAETAVVVAYPVSFHIRVRPVTTLQKKNDPGDYQFILQWDEESDAYFEGGACEHQKRIAGRPTDTITAILPPPPSSHNTNTTTKTNAIPKLWGAWAAGHEPVKLLSGYQFHLTTTTTTTTVTTTDAKAEAKAAEEPSPQQPSAVLSWSDYVVSKEGCPRQRDETTGKPAIVLPPDSMVRIVDPSTRTTTPHKQHPTELRVLNEQEPSTDSESPTLLDIAFADDDTPGAAPLPPNVLVVWQVLTAAVSGSTVTKIIPAYWTASTAKCGKSRLITNSSSSTMESSSSSSSFVVQLEIPHQPHSDHVVVTVQAIYESNTNSTLLYKTKPLELHWQQQQQKKQSPPHKQPQQQQQHAQVQNDENTQEQQQQHDQEPKTEQDDRQTQKAREEEEALQKAAAEEEENAKLRLLAEQAAQKIVRPHISSKKYLEKEDPQRILDLSIQKDLRQHLKELQEKQRQQQQQNKHGGHHKDHGPAKPYPKRHVPMQQHQPKQQAPPLDDVPLVLWQDSSYYMGLVILVGGIYGTIVVCIFCHNFLLQEEKKGRQE